jgi:predicted nucleotidyltransferase
MRQNFLDQCNWPDLEERYDLALREAVAFILENFNSSGIIASGTIIRGNPDPTSDLDIYVIHQESFRRRIQKYFNKVPAEIFVNPPSMVENYFIEEGAARRPITAHMLATGFVILELDPVVSTLRQRAAEILENPPESSSESLTMARYLAALLFEDALDVVERDPATAQMLLSRAVTEMLHYSFARADRYLPRPKELLTQVAEVDAEAAGLAQAFFKNSLFETRLKFAKQLADRVLGVRGFFKWESIPDEVGGEE